MYKVFIQNKPLFFTDRKNVKKVDGVIINLQMALLNRDFILNILDASPSIVPVYILCENPRIGINEFFKDYDWIEAAGGIVKRKKKYLFIERNGIWDLPKGKIDLGEDKQEAALREIEEECGIKCDPVIKKLAETFHVYDYKGKKTIKLTYWYSLTYDGNKNLIAQSEEGITQAVWVDKSRALQMRLETYPSLIDVIDSYFGTKKRNN